MRIVPRPPEIPALTSNDSFPWQSHRPAGHGRLAESAVGTAASQVLAETDNLAQQANLLRNEVDSFLESVRLS